MSDQSRSSITNVNDFNGVCPVDAEVISYDVTAVAVNDVIKTPYNTTIIPSDDSATMHEGAMPDPAGGTLRYNKRGKLLKDGERGPLHDPTALVYVPTDDFAEEHSDDAGPSAVPQS